MAKNQWKGFAIKATVFLIIIVCVDILVGKTYKKLEDITVERAPFGMVTEYTMWKVNTDMVIIGGSEACHSYIPSLLEDSLGLSVYNCGKDGCRFYYQSAMIHGILDRYSPKVIIWSISPGELSTPSEKDQGNLSQLNPFYNENEFCRQVLKTKSKYEPVKLLSKSYSYNSELFRYFFLIKSDYSYEKGGYAPLYGTTKALDIANRSWEDYYDTNIREVFSNTLDRCIQQGVQVICVFTPRYENEKHEDMYSYQQLLTVLAEKKVPLIEALYHDPDLMNSNLFKDNAHLNHDGALMFCNKLSCILVSIIN